MRIEEENLFESLFIASAGNISLAQLSDVSDSLSPSSGQVLTWNGSMWVATTPSGGGGGGGTSNVVVLNDLTDVIASSPTNNQVLTYDTSVLNPATNNLGAWVPKTPSSSSSSPSSLGDLANVSDSVDDGGMSGILWHHPSNDQWMRVSLDSNYFTIDWNNYTLSLTNIGSGSGASELKELSDVNSNLSPSAGSVLAYDSYNSKWDSKSLELDDLSNIDTTSVQNGYVLTYNNINQHWEAQAPTGGSGPSTTYYADNYTTTLSSTTFSTISSPALRVDTAGYYVNYTLPAIPYNVYNVSGNDYKYCFLGVVKDGDNPVALDWFNDYSFDTEPSSGSANLIASGDLYNCFGNGVDGTTIEVNSSGKLHVIGGTGGATQLNGLSDVDSSLNPSNGQVLTYNNTSQQWEAQTPSGGGSSNLTWEEH